MRSRPVVAIDGPAGAGKSTVTQRVAQELDYLLLGTGALYRAVAFAAQRAEVPWSDPRAVGQLAEALTARGALRIERAHDGEQRVLLDEEDITDDLYTEHMGGGASQVSAVPAVRAALLDVQRRAGAQGGIVAEGRDVGTVVFPDAEAKFFLTATIEVRAQRRYQEMVARGIDADLDAIFAEVKARDERDSSREIAPLKRASDAVVVDSSEMSVDEVVGAIVAWVHEVEANLR